MILNTISAFGVLDLSVVRNCQLFRVHLGSATQFWKFPTVVALLPALWMFFSDRRYCSSTSPRLETASGS